VLTISVFVAVAVPGAVEAANRTATDDRASVEFHLRGHLLTARVIPKDVRIGIGTAERLQGRLVTAACGTRLAFGRGTTTHRTRRWPRDAMQLRFWFSRNVSNQVRWCVLETGKSGGDVARVYFKRG
jgi:hypothetical protein